MSYFPDDNIPVVDELAAMGFNTGDVQVEEYVPTKGGVVSSCVKRVKGNKDALLEYRDVQSLLLTEMQAKVLNAISDRKIQEAPLKDLVGAYKVLKEKEHLSDGKPTEITGLVGYLLELEAEEKEEAKKVTEIVINPEDITDVK